MRNLHLVRHASWFLTAVALLGAVAMVCRADAPVTSPSKLGDTWTNSIGMKLTYIPPGEFVMGSPTSEARRDNDETQHRVKLTKSFMIGVYPVTQAQWKSLMGSNPSHFKGDDRPVEMASWSDAVAFCKKLSVREGKHYRLPTEAEWEYACRAGTTTAYYFGDDASKLPDYAWFWGNSQRQTHPVGQKAPNAWGLYDMIGNAWEWCSDWYGPYPARAVTDPTGPATGESRILRNGSWDDEPSSYRSAARYWFDPDGRANDYGFRVCVDLP